MWPGGLDAFACRGPHGSNRGGPHLNLSDCEHTDEREGEKERERERETHTHAPKSGVECLGFGPLTIRWSNDMASQWKRAHGELLRVLVPS